MRILELSGGAMGLADFVSSAGIGGVDFQFPPEFRERTGGILDRGRLPRTSQKRASYAIVNAGR